MHRYTNWLAGLSVISLSVWAEPTPVDDEAFLMFLAEMVEIDGELTDPLSMTTVDIEDLESEPVAGEKSSDSIDRPMQKTEKLGEL